MSTQSPSSHPDHPHPTPPTAAGYQPLSGPGSSSAFTTSAMTGAVPVSSGLSVQTPASEVSTPGVDFPGGWIDDKKLAGRRQGGGARGVDTLDSTQERMQNLTLSEGAHPTIMDSITDTLSHLQLPGFWAPLAGDERHPTPPSGLQGPPAGAPMSGVKEINEGRAEEVPGFVPLMPGIMDKPWQAAPFMAIGSDQTGSLSHTETFPEPATTSGSSEQAAVAKELPALAAGGALGAAAGSAAASSGGSASTPAKDDILASQPKNTAPGQPIVQPLSEKHAETFENMQTGSQLPKTAASQESAPTQEKDSHKTELEALAAGGVLGAGAAGAWGAARHHEVEPTSTASNSPAGAAAGSTSTGAMPPSGTSTTASLLGTQPKQTPAGQPIVPPLSEKHASTFSSLQTTTQLPKTASQLEPTTADLLGEQPKKTPKGEPIVPALSEKHGEVFDKMGRGTQLPKSGPAPEQERQKEREREKELAAVAAGGAVGIGAAEALHHSKDNQTAASSPASTTPATGGSANLLGTQPKQAPAGQPIVPPLSEKHREAFEHSNSSSQAGHGPAAGAGVAVAGVAAGALTAEEVKKNRELAAAAGLSTPGAEGVLSSCSDPAAERQKKIDDFAASASAGHPGVLSESDRLEGGQARGERAHEPSVVDAHGRKQVLGAAAVGGVAGAALVDGEKGKEAPALGQNVMGAPASATAQATQPAPIAKPQPESEDADRQRKIREAEAFAGGAAGVGALSEAERLKRSHAPAEQTQEAPPSFAQRAPGPLPRVDEVDTPRDERGNVLAGGTATIISAPRHGDGQVDEELAAAGARTREEPVPEGMGKGPYGTGQHQHRETALEKEVQSEDRAGAPAGKGRDGNGHRMAEAAVVGGAAGAAGGLLWDEKVGGGNVYGLPQGQGYPNSKLAADQQSFAPSSTGAQYGGSTFGGSDWPSGENTPARQQTSAAPQGGEYHQAPAHPQVVTFNQPPQDENEPIASGEPQRRRSLLRKKPSKKLAEEEKQRRRSLSTEPAASPGVPEKRRRGSMGEKEHHHRKLHKKRRSVGEGAFAGPDGGPGRAGVPIDYENESSPEEGRGSTEEELAYPRVTRLNGEDEYVPPVEEGPQASYGASGWAPALAQAQGADHSEQPQQKQAPYGTDWRTADVSGSSENNADNGNASGGDSPNRRKPSVLRKVLGGSKMLSGQLAMDYGKVEQGKLLSQGYVHPAPQQQQ